MWQLTNVDYAARVHLYTAPLADSRPWLEALQEQGLIKNAKVLDPGVFCWRKADGAPCFIPYEVGAGLLKISSKTGFTGPFPRCVQGFYAGIIEMLQDRDTKERNSMQRMMFVLGALLGAAIALRILPASADPRQWAAEILTGVTVAVFAGMFVFFCLNALKAPSFDTEHCLEFEIDGVLNASTHDHLRPMLSVFESIFYLMEPDVQVEGDPLLVGCRDGQYYVLEGV